jgi:hypothetical protein
MNTLSISSFESFPLFAIKPSYYFHNTVSPISYYHIPLEDVQHGPGLAEQQNPRLLLLPQPQQSVNHNHLARALEIAALSSLGQVVVRVVHPLGTLERKTIKKD